MAPEKGAHSTIPLAPSGVFTKGSLFGGTDITITNTATDLAHYNNTNTTFTILITNQNTGSTAMGFAVDIAISAGLQFVKATPSSGTYDPLTNRWSPDDLGPQATATLILEVKPIATGEQFTTSTVINTESNPGTTGNSATETITIEEAADIELTSQILPNAGPYYLGDVVSLTVNAANVGPNNATDVVILESLPAGATLISATPSLGTTYVNGIWTIGALASNTSASLVLTVRLTSFGDQTNVASKTNSAPFDPNGANTAGGNNTTTLTFTVEDREAEYTIEIPSQHFYKFNNNDIIGQAIDGDGTIVSASLVNGDVLPAGTSLQANGNLVVSNKFLLRPETYAIDIQTTDNAGGTTTSTLEFAITRDWDNDGVVDYTDENDPEGAIADLDDNNDGITDFIANLGAADAFSTQPGSSNFTYADQTYTHPSYGAFRDNNNDGINDWYDIDLDGIVNSLDVDMDGDGITNVTEANGGKNPDATLYTHASGTMVVSNDYPVTDDGIPTSALKAGATPEDDLISIFAIITTSGTGPTQTQTQTSGLEYVHYINTDKDKFADFHDLDTDNDGLLDLIEAQAPSVNTAGYRPVLLTEEGENVDADQNGLNDEFDTEEGGGLPLIPVNTDAAYLNPDAIPDYLELDSDGDLAPDYYEGFDYNHNGTAIAELIALGQAFNDRTGTTYYGSSDLGGQVTTTDGVTTNNPNTIPDWLDQSANGLPNFLDPVFGGQYYRDTDQDGLVDLYDTDNGGITPIPAQIIDAPLPDFRDQTVNNGTGPGGVTLPVTLKSFTGQAQPNGVLLTWVTASEKDNDFFEVQRSVDGKTFQVIGNVKGSGTTTIEARYSLLDVNQAAGTVYYRLRQVDFDGKDELSKIVVVKGTQLPVTANAYPNPTTGLVQLTFTGTSGSKATATIQGITGKVYAAQAVTLGSGQTLDLSNLPAGTYIVKITGEGFSTVLRIIKQ
ncbi:T9SS type A sorting domain-containing protein [Rufibacter sp. LB8]|uniref:T9SS type A sorting domain-containing protein n=1 Tax=Rufibacter sp. LB8 TaxID=2777781 RepID=UPI00178C5F8A|nr:T9SS type A sorting domain-containing protein [Rufibacter sp. LB8]